MPGRDLDSRTISPQRIALRSMLGAEWPEGQLEVRASQVLLCRQWGVLGFYSVRWIVLAGF